MSSSVTRRARKRLKRENAASACLAICFLASIGPLKAQYIGDQLPGLSGLKAGSQPAPGVYVTLPLYFRYSNITINGAQGNQVLKNLTAGINLFVLPGVEVITPFKILGATYGAAYTQWINNGVLDVASPSFHRVTSYHFGDIYVQPVILGGILHGPTSLRVTPFLRQPDQRGSTCGLMKSTWERRCIRIAARSGT